MATATKIIPAFDTGYRADIDGLRAIAVTAVILFHAHIPPFSGGFVGVDVFFVISGYLITSIILRDLHHGRFSILTFYERRIRRIFPALFFLLIMLTPLALTLLLPVETLRFGKTLLATALFSANVYFWRSAGYFAPDLQRNLLLHTWSLSVEEQFYVFFPLFLLLLLKLPRRWAVAVLAAALLGSLGLAQWQVHVRTEATFYLLPTRAWELLTGAALALVGVPAPRPLGSLAAGLGGLALVLAPVVAYTRDTLFPGFSAVAPCAGTALLLYAGMVRGGLLARMLGSAPLAFVGRISYSLYLWHLPLLVAARIHLDRELTANETLLAIAAAAAIAWFSYVFVETPFRRAGAPRDRWRVISVGAAVSFLACAIGATLYFSGGVPWRYPSIVVTADAAQVDETYPPSCVGPNAAGARNGCLDAHFDLLVWGDSHAAHYFAGIARHAEAKGLKAQLQWVGGCPPVLGAVPVTVRPPLGSLLEPEPHLNPSCAQLNRETLATIKRSPELKAVVLAGAWSFWSEGLDIGTDERRYLTDGADGPYSVAETRRVLHDGLSRTVAQLRSLGLEVLLLGQVPDDERSPSECLAEAYLAHAEPNACGRRASAVRARMLWSRKTLREIAARYDAYVFDPLATLCADTRCEVEAHGTPLYRDSDHLTSFGSKIAVENLGAEFFDVASRLERPRQAAAAPIERESP